MDRYPNFPRPDAPNVPTLPPDEMKQTPASAAEQATDAPVLSQTPVAPAAPNVPQAPVAPQIPPQAPVAPNVPQMPYGYPYTPPYGAYQPPVQKKGRGLAVTAMVLGICSVVFAGVIGILLAIIGLVFSIVAMKKCKGPDSGRGMAITGLVCSIVGFFVSVLAILYFVWLFSAFSDLAENSLDSFDYYFNF
ncbi:MAG: DUF4190 domain-containing protein [Clostridia bacterium]|nr:DUF4190 domain-containing protein [Clostridia bacterium]